MRRTVIIVFLSPRVCQRHFSCTRCIINIIHLKNIYIEFCLYKKYTLQICHTEFNSVFKIIHRNVATMSSYKAVLTFIKPTVQSDKTK